MTRVLVVVGAARCGSTVLGACLGGVRRVVNIGELKNLWSICLARPNFPCGCGAPVASCPFWSAVLNDAGLGDASVEEMVAVEREAAHWPDVRYGVTAGTRPASAFVEAVAAVYDAVARRTGADLVVDTSKWPPFAAAVAAHPRVDATAVHLVRDPRGHVVSRHRGWHGELGLQHPLDRKASARVVLSWTKTNALGAALTARSGERMTRLRYEDFVAHPAASLDALLALSGHGENASNVDGSDVTLGLQHSLAGSRTDRVVTRTTLTPDDAWRSFLAPRVQRELYLLGWPLTQRYGYPLTAQAR